MAIDITERALASEKEAVLRKALVDIHPAGYVDTPAGLDAIEVELHTRPYWFRARYIPWLQSHLDLQGAKVLEIGGGTGTSAIPLAEQGAMVRSIDIAEPGLRVAEIRASLHELSEKTQFKIGNADNIASDFPDRDFDLIIYFASLEHMTYSERIKTLKSAWEMIKFGGHLAVVDTPNRLWFYDNHTTFSNFYHWLPEPVAIDYAKRTSRVGFNSDFDVPSDDAPVRLARWGRGVSYHEFEIAIGSLADLEISGEWQFMRQSNPVWADAYAATTAGKYLDFLRGVAPEIAPQFLEEELALSLRKPLANRRSAHDH